MKTTFTFILLFSVPTFSQISISASTGISPHITLQEDTPDYLNKYWGMGIVFGVSGEVLLTSFVAVAPSIAFTLHPFVRYNPGTTFPELYPERATGEPSKVWRFLAEVGFIPSGRMSPVYCTTGIGYVIEQFGTIQVPYLGGSIYDINLEKETFFVHTLGLGFRWDLSSDFGLELIAQYFSNYKDRLSVEFKVGLVYSLK